MSGTFTMNRYDEGVTEERPVSPTTPGCSPFTMLSFQTLAPSGSRDEHDKMFASYEDRAPNRVSFFNKMNKVRDVGPSQSKLHMLGDRRAKISASVLKTGRVISSKVERALDRARLRAKNVSEKLATPENVIKRDKLGFTAGIALLIFTEYVFLQERDWIKAWYSAVIIPLYFIRYFLYHAVKTHYFLIDFCYVVNLLLLFTLHYYPNSPVLFKVAFALATGPVPAAIIAWRNSLVFHSLDKVTSVVIHLLPCGVAFCMRWFPAETTGNQLVPAERLSWFGIVDLIIKPFMVYAYWQAAYFLKTQVVDRQYFEQQRDTWTSARWLSRHRTSKGLANKLINKSGTEELSINISLIKIQVLYTVITLVPIPILYHSYICHSLYLIVICFFCVHNGAGYYFEVFSRKYIEDVMMHAHHEAQKDKQETQRSERMPSGVSDDTTPITPTPAKTDLLRGDMGVHTDSSEDLGLGEHKRDAFMWCGS